MESANQLRPGSLLRGRRIYRIERVLGHGGFGITYLATFEAEYDGLPVKVSVAIKEHFVGDYNERAADGMTVTTPGTAKARQTVANSLKDFLAEARRLASLSPRHPNIVRVDEVFEANSTAYYVMQYIDGESLRDYLKSHGALRGDTLRELTVPVIDALAYLHSHRITHLDVKPANIMLKRGNDDRLQPILIDFGLSKHFDLDGMPTSTVNGAAISKGYSPPEQYAGLTTFSPAADVYAMGATMLACATARKPFDSLTRPKGEPAATLSQLSIDRRTKGVIARAMADHAADRYADASAMLEDLSQSLSLDAEQDDITRPLDNTVINIGNTVREDVKPTPSKVEVSTPVAPPYQRPLATEVYNDALRDPQEGIGRKLTKNERNLILAGFVAILAIFVGVFLYSQNDKWNVYRTYGNLDLAVERDGEYYFFSVSEWNALSEEEKRECNKHGLVIEYKGEEFMLALEDLADGDRLTWKKAMSRYGNELPTKVQAEDIARQYQAVNSALAVFGGQTMKSWYWTQTEYNTTEAWYLTMNNGSVAYNTKLHATTVRAVAPVPGRE